MFVLGGERGGGGGGSGRTSSMGTAVLRLKPGGDNSDVALLLRGMKTELADDGDEAVGTFHFFVCSSVSLFLHAGTASDFDVGGEVESGKLPVVAECCRPTIDLGDVDFFSPTGGGGAVSGTCSGLEN